MMFVLQTKKGQEVLYEVSAVAQTRSQQKLFSGSQRSVSHAGPLQRRVHPRHLYAHHQRDAEGRGGEDRRLHGDGHGQTGTA